MAASSLSIIPAVTLAYSDARRILRAMTMLVVFAVLIALAIKVAEDLFPQYAGRMRRVIMSLPRAGVRIEVSPPQVLEATRR